MRGRSSSFLGFVMTAVVAVPSAAFVMQRTVLDREPEHRMELTSASGNVSISNSREGQAILTAAPMVPGSQTTGTVELANTGDVDERLVLDAGTPVDQPGPGGGKLSERLQLRVEDVTDAGPADVVFDGALRTLDLEDLGRIAKGERRIYRFTVVFPDGGANGADNAYMGSSASVGFDWSVTQSGPAEPPANAPLPEQIAGDQPLAYWPLDGSQADMNDVVGGFTGEYANTVVTAPGPAPGGGKAAWFDGASSYGYVNGITAPTQAYTLSAWIKPAPAGASSSAVGARSGGEVDDMIILEHGAGGTLAVRDGRFVFRHVDTQVTSVVEAQSDRWQMVVGVWDGSNRRARLYVDGELVASVATNDRPSGAATLYAGRGDWAGLPSFHGAMAQLSYYGTPLAGDRIGAQWTAGKVAAAPPSTPAAPATPADPGTPAAPAQEPGQMSVGGDSPSCPGSVSAQGGATDMWSILKARSDAAAKKKKQQAAKAKKAKKRSKKAKARGKARKASKKQATAKRNTCGRTTQRAGG